jgi:hypothetical protein
MAEVEVKELVYLKSMWAHKVRRKTELIVPEVTYHNNQGSLNNESWAFKVPYAFREALDIKFEQRKKNKKPYMVWTQGPILSFKDGDLIHTKDGKRAVQVQFASQMGWDPITDEMYQGSVVYYEYDTSETSPIKTNEYTCTQMQFLQLLITGEYDE